MGQARTQRGSRPYPVGMRRAIGLLAFMPVASRAPSYSRLIWELVRDERTPIARKGLLAVGLGYLVLGRDLIPDNIPILGGLDDLLVMVLAVDLFLDGLPADLLDEKLDLLGIDRGSFERDVNQIRRLMPGPLRRAIRRIPQAATMVGHAVQATGAGPRLRSWINKEGSPA